MVDISIVLIGFNDAKRLPRALESLRGQSLQSIEIIAVDDCSTDDSMHILRKAADEDSRITVEQLKENSGGCSAPRNRGIELAQGTYVMFCDSDDEFDRHACRNLLNAAEEMRADVVVGAAARIVTEPNGKTETKIWWPELHSRAKSVEDLAALPELLYDTISVNKIYRRELLTEHMIDFPRGLLFEDQLFTLKVYLASGRIGVIPEVVYRWYVDRSAASITQSRKELKNLADRIEINRRMDSLLVDTPKLLFDKQVKFLRHEASLYLTTIFESDGETAGALERELATYCMTIPVGAFEHVRPGLRVAFYYLLLGDHDNLMAALLMEKGGGVIDADLSRSGGSMWGPVGQAVLGQPAQRWLDVSSLHIALIPFNRRKYRHVLTANGEIITTDFLGDLGADLTAQLLLTETKTGELIAVPLRATVEEHGRVTWRPDVKMPKVLQDRGINSGEQGQVHVELRKGADTNRCEIEAPSEGPVAPIAPMDISSFASFGCANTIEFTRATQGILAWQAAGSSKSPGSLIRKVNRRSAGKPPTRPQPFTVPTGRPIFVYAPQSVVAFSTRMVRFDTEDWIKNFGADAFLLVPQEPFTPAPSRARYAYRTYSEYRRVEAIRQADWIITDVPELLALPNTIAFQRDLAAARYLLVPTGIPMLTSTTELNARVRQLIEESAL